MPVLTEAVVADSYTTTETTLGVEIKMCIPLRTADVHELIRSTTVHASSSRTVLVVVYNPLEEYMF